MKKKIYPPGQVQQQPASLKEQLINSLLDVYDLMRMFQVSKGTIHNWCQNGTLRFSKIGNRRFFKTTDVENLLEERKQHLRRE